MKPVTQKKKRPSKLKRFFQTPTYFGISLALPGFFKLEITFGKKAQ